MASPGSPHTIRNPAQKIQATSSCQENGHTFRGPQCTAWVECHNGILTVKHCTGGLVWNEVIQACDWKLNVPSCAGVVFTRRAEGSPSVNPHMIQEPQSENQSLNSFIFLISMIFIPHIVQICHQPVSLS